MSHVMRQSTQFSRGLTIPARPQNRNIPQNIPNYIPKISDQMRYDEAWQVEVYEEPKLIEVSVNPPVPKLKIGHFFTILNLRLQAYLRYNLYWADALEYRFHDRFFV